MREIPCGIEIWNFATLHHRNVSVQVRERSNHVQWKIPSRRVRGIVRGHRSSCASKQVANGTSYFVCAKYSSVQQRSFDIQFGDQLLQVRRSLHFGVIEIGQDDWVGALARSFDSRHICVTSFEIIEFIAITQEHIGWLFSCIVHRRQNSYDLFGEFNWNFDVNLASQYPLIGTLAYK